MSESLTNTISTPAAATTKAWESYRHTTAHEQKFLCDTFEKFKKNKPESLLGFRNYLLMILNDQQTWGSGVSVKKIKVTAQSILDALDEVVKSLPVSK